MIKIIVDAFGGDKSPIVNIEGAIQALNALSDLTIILVEIGRASCRERV